MEEKIKFAIKHGNFRALPVTHFPPFYESPQYVTGMFEIYFDSSRRAHILWIYSYTQYSILLGRTFEAGKYECKDDEADVAAHAESIRMKIWKWKILKNENMKM